MLGLKQAVRLLMIAIFARAHVLLDGNVGVGKATLLRAVATGKTMPEEIQGETVSHLILRSLVIVMNWLPILQKPCLRKLTLKQQITQLAHKQKSHFLDCEGHQEGYPCAYLFHFGAANMMGINHTHNTYTA